VKAGRALALPVFAFVAFALALAPAALAQVHATNQCLTTPVEGQKLRKADKLLGARDKFGVCARDNCPREIVHDCTQWAREVEALIPSVVLAARDSSGRDLLDVRISIDGNPPADASPRAMELDPGVLRRMRDQLLLFYTGEARSASKVLADQDERSKSGDQEMIENLHHTKELGRRSYELLLSGDLDGYGELLHEHWEHKRRRSPGMSDEQIDRLYTLARRSGSIGGKLVGAGGGGFLLIYASRPEDIRQAMAAAGVTELQFDFEFGGAYASESG